MTHHVHGGQPDNGYNLVSVLYHALSGADSCRKYIEDAESAEDKELSNFFGETHTLYRSLVEKAQKLTASRLAGQ